MSKRIKIILSVMTIIIIACAFFLKTEAEYRNNNQLLREIFINGEEIEPKFDQFVTEYVIAEEGTNIQIEPITDDPNATYQLIGNTNLKDGLNRIEIKVTAEDEKTTMSYYINVNKTSDIAKANANLESLEVEGLIMNPKFNDKDIKYYIEYEGIIDRLNIKAVPQSKNAKVEITGNEGFDNGTIQLIEIKVTAEDEITTKKYQIVAKKAGEDVENPSGLEEYEKEIEDLEKKENQKNYLLPLIIISFVVILIIGGIIIMRKRKK